MKTHPVKRSLALSKALGLAVVAAAAQASGANLLLNPSFEAPPGVPGDNQDFAIWTPINDVSRATFANKTPGGMYGLWLKTFQPAGGGVEQTVDVVGGTNYDLKSQIKFEASYPDTISVTQMHLNWLDSGNNLISTDALNLGPSGVTTGTWQEFTLSATAPINAAKVRVFLGWQDGGVVSGPQSVFMDDVVLDGLGNSTATSTWVADVAGDYHNAANWANGSVPNGLGATAQFHGAITAPRSVYADIATVAGNLSFDNANSYVLGGAGSLSIQVSTGSGSISVAQGSHKINLPLFFASNTDIGVAGGATLTLGNPVTVRANKTVNKTGAVVIQAPLTLEAGASFVLGGGVSTIFGAPTMGAGAKIDVKNSTMSVDYRGLGSVANAIKAQLTTGYAAGAWNGPGINTSSATSLIGLGWKDDAANQRVLVKYTYYGDSNLDGQVDITDLAALATAWQTSGVWVNGDFDYSGFIDITDLAKLATNWQAGVGAPLSMTFEQALASVGLGGVAVPEPATIGLLGLASLAAVRRRR